MSRSDQDMSDCSNLESPQSYTTNGDSPYSSPSQQVPQLTTDLTELSCRDKTIYAFSGNKALLRIVEQPQNYFRFRYVSEMVGTHGCLLGKSSYGSNKPKTHPTVELVNYPGQALISCWLVQHNNADEHPHKLKTEDELDRELNKVVPDGGSYKVCFPNMGIIHTAKKDVPTLLFKKFTVQNRNFNTKELQLQCENLAKSINLNIVRLKFTAHDINTKKEICEPVFSEPIHNMKSAATNDLRICRMSRVIGRPRGGDDVFLLVEKVNKKNIVIRMYELDDSGEEYWSATGHFLQTDVHHQYAIVFRTPAYKNPQTPVDVKVYVQLLRPSDGRTSEPKEFTYKADQIYRQQSKKRKTASSYSSLDSSSGGSIRSINDIPVSVLGINQVNAEEIDSNVPMFSMQQLQPVSPSNQCDLANALNMSPITPEVPPQGPMWSSDPTQPGFPDLRLNSSDIQDIIGLPENRQEYTHADWGHYLSSLSSFNDIQTDGLNTMDYIRMSASLVGDSGRGQRTSGKAPAQAVDSTNIKQADTLENKSNSDYPAYYKSEDGSEVKKLVKELCEVIRNKKGFKNQEVRTKLEKLFNIRLSNGDTFLHMTLCSNQPSFEYIVKLIHSVKMQHLLNYTNDKQQSILHLAVMNELPSVVALLISKGCNPMQVDNEGENVIHYAVKNNVCLETLLDTIKKNKVPCNLNDSNMEKHSPLHLAALYNRADGARLLLQHGASYNVRDTDGRTPTHLAAYDDYIDVLRALLEFVVPSDIDATDGRGNTALQIVCGGTVRQNTAKMVELLLEKKADPMTHADHNESAWRLTRDKLELRDIMKKYVTIDVYEDDVKSEPEDDFESADEGEGDELEELPLYIRDVSEVMDKNGSWRELATRLSLDASMSWCHNQLSPTHALLTQLKQCRSGMSSQSLALILDDMGQYDAASFIKRYTRAD